MCTQMTDADSQVKFGKCENDADQGLCALIPLDSSEASENLMMRAKDLVTVNCLRPHLPEKGPIR